MEENEENNIEEKHCYISFKINQDNITSLDLSNKNIKNLDEVLLLENLKELILARNELTCVPDKIMNLQKINTLDISFNKIEYFDETPKFYNTIEKLNISNNRLKGPPYWIWVESCENLVEVNLSCNGYITDSFTNGYYEELLQYKCLVTDITIYNCRLKDHLELLSTFPKAKRLKAGTSELDHLCNSNKLEEIPYKGLDKLCDIEVLELSNTHIYNINSNIAMYKRLKEINLSLNNLGGLPEEFCNLENLEVCILSFNSLLYLPEGFNKLEKLEILLLNGNNLCMIPENLYKLPNLKILDLYDNYLYQGPDDIEKLDEIDLAQNYFDEPETVEYCQRKKKIRLSNPERFNGRKLEVTKPESEYSRSVTDDEDLLKSIDNESEIVERPLSSPEDWDSDDYWIPHHNHQPNPSQPTWHYFIKQKMMEGNFCPIDAHQVPVAEQVRYEKLCNPKVVYESDGQFDDYSGDDS